MTDHHIIIAFAVAGQAAFIFMYLMAIRETRQFKRNFVAWVGVLAWILFLFAVNCFAMKLFIEFDRESTRKEEAYMLMQQQRLQVENLQRKRVELNINRWQIEYEREIQEYNKYLNQMLIETKKRRELIKESHRNIKRFKCISTPAALIPPSIRAKPSNSFIHAEYLPLFNAAVK